jgi:hypothetical protein
MESELFCDDYYVTMDEKTKNLIEELTIWKTRHIMLYPNDVMNLLIHYGFATQSEIEKILETSSNNKLDITLPVCYIS